MGGEPSLISALFSTIILVGLAVCLSGWSSLVLISPPVRDLTEPPLETTTLEGEERTSEDLTCEQLFEFLLKIYFFLPTMTLEPFSMM